MSDPKIKELGAILRRVLFLMQVLQFNLDDLKAYSICPPLLKPNIGNCKNAMNAFKNNIIVNTKSNVIQQHLASENMHDLNLIFEQLQGIENLEDVYTWLCELTEKAKTDA